MKVPVYLRGEFLRATERTSKKGNAITTLYLLTRSDDDAEKAEVTALTSAVPADLQRGDQLAITAEVSASDRGYLNIWARAVQLVQA